MTNEAELRNGDVTFEQSPILLNGDHHHADLPPPVKDTISKPTATSTASVASPVTNNSNNTSTTSTNSSNNSNSTSSSTNTSPSNGPLPSNKPSKHAANKHKSGKLVCFPYFVHTFSYESIANQTKPNQNIQHVLVRTIATWTSRLLLNFTMHIQTRMRRFWPLCFDVCTWLLTSFFFSSSFSFLILFFLQFYLKKITKQQTNMHKQTLVVISNALLFFREQKEEFFFFFLFIISFFFIKFNWNQLDSFNFFHFRVRQLFCSF